MKYKCLKCGAEFDALYEVKCPKCGAKDWDCEPLHEYQDRIAQEQEIEMEIAGK